MREIILPAVQGMAKEGVPYTGFLYAGLMIDRAGNPKTLEFNCRLGDPEAQPILLRLKSDLFELLEHALAGTLDCAEADWDRRSALGVVLAAHGYPEEPRKGDRIEGLPRPANDCRVFQAGTRLEGKSVLTNGGRVLGSRLPPSATAARPQLAGQAYDAMGVSLVLHPRNPYCPTAHMNVRFFSAASAWWFGGGMDLTPYYGFEDDARHFHAACRDALAPLGAAYYPRFKRECDEYFQLRHRGEPRGIGGIFFDHFADRV